jgi:hypothetical protein
MSEDQKPDTTEEVSSAPESQGSTSAGAEGYIDHVKEVLTRPDDYFADDARYSRNYGLISAGAFLGLIFLHSVITRVTRFSSWSFEFSYMITAFKIALAFGLPIVAAVFVLRWLEGRSGGSARSVDFYIARFGAMLIVPALMVAVAVPLNLFNVVLHGWFRGGAVILLYISVFMLSYLYAAKGQLRSAVLMTIGFYFAYRLLGLLL